MTTQMDLTAPASPSDGRVDSNPQFTRHIWDTAYVPERERFSYYRDALCESYLKLSPENPGAGFAGRVETINLGRVGISLNHNTPMTVTRNKAELAQVDPGYVYLQIQLSGARVLRMDGEETRLNTGQIMIGRSDRGFSCQLGQTGPQSSLSLSIEKSVITDMIGTDTLHQTLMLSHQKQVLSHSPLAPALFNCLSTLNARFQAGSPREIQALYDASVSVLVASLLRDDRSVEANYGDHRVARHGVLTAIKNFINHNLHDPNLSPGSVAIRFGISTRYLHKLFAGQQQTFSDYLVSQRLDRTRIDLLNPSHAHLTVADIAFRWGFKDISNFHRTFKARFAMTPGQSRFEP